MTDPQTGPQQLPGLAIDLSPARSTDDVLAAMRAIESNLVPAGEPPRDGIAWFNRLYLTTTESIVASVKEAGFLDPGALSRLDVIFGNLYFEALRRFASAPASTPRAWRPLFQARSQQDIAPLQFAIAGMNAHINRDLPVALFEWWRDPAVAPLDRARLRADFDRVNTILARVQDEAKERFLHGAWRVLDRAFGRVDDVVAIFSIAEARNAAWTQGEVLTTLGGPGRPLGRAYLDSLDGVVGLAGRGLLVATALGPLMGPVRT